MTEKEQIGFDFGEQDLGIASEAQLEKAFQGFHKNHPDIWRLFMMETLRAVYEGRVPIRPHAIMEIVRRQTSIPVDYRLIRLYRDMFTSNHQELSLVFKD